ncbi:MAG: serine/threonine protein kinase [Phycisphaerae bacterium]|nr:serine/threonine protein kinase [Phycisphaerae bacterium]
MSNTQNHRGDTQLARLLLDQSLVGSDEMSKCLAKQKELREQGIDKPLAEILVEFQYVTSSQIERIAKFPDDESLYQPAQQIPGFQILSKVGQGAMATVFKAKQLRLDRIVAVKVLPKRLSENPEFVDRFYREGRAAARLNHPNIVQAIDVGEAAGYHYFVMEYVDGKTVYDGLTNGGCYKEDEALSILRQVSQALEHAHARGFIHRDVKPKNIMITKEGVVKLADMGLAREISDYETAKAEAGRAYGTPYYISPEQIRGEVNIDFRADIYSLGATMYHMVTGRVPFEGSTPTAVMHKHLREPLIPPDHINMNLSSGIGEIIEVMMAKRREERYSSATELISDIEAVLGGDPPFQARKRYDQGLLRSIADSGVTVYTPKPEDINPSEKSTQNWTAVLVLSFFLALSILINIWLLQELISK